MKCAFNINPTCAKWMNPNDKKRSKVPFKSNEAKQERIKELLERKMEDGKR